ncbi:MAG TPA: hypothetical protein VHJ78_13390, partial [Actinomycetota bacterium]|nr:hypothetical protein [Actinomycetota bacterium]
APGVEILEAVPSPEPPPAAAQPSVEEREVARVLAQPSPIAARQSASAFPQTTVMLLAGFFGTTLFISLTVAMVAGGRWHKRHLAARRRS